MTTPSCCALQCRVHLPPGPPVGPWGLIVNYPTLSYKRLGWTLLPKGQKKERLRQGRLEHNTTQFSHGHRVLCSGDPNNVNHRVHHVHLELTTNRLNAFPTKEPQRATPVAALVEVPQNHVNNRVHVIVAASLSTAGPVPESCRNRFYRGSSSSDDTSSSSRMTRVCLPLPGAAAGLEPPAGPPPRPLAGAPLRLPAGPPPAGTPPRPAHGPPPRL
jgi:hypothetical protein